MQSSQPPKKRKLLTKAALSLLVGFALGVICPYLPHAYQLVCNIARLLLGVFR